jgi:hypothetical protein
VYQQAKVRVPPFEKHWFMPLSVALFLPTFLNQTQRLRKIMQEELSSYEQYKVFPTYGLITSKVTLTESSSLL